MNIFNPKARTMKRIWNACSDIYMVICHINLAEEVSLNCMNIGEIMGINNHIL